MAAEILCLGQEAVQSESVKLVAKLLGKMGQDEVRASQLPMNSHSLAQAVANNLKTSKIIVILSGSTAGESTVREVISAGLGRRLELNQTRLQHLRQYYQRTGRQMPESEARRAMLPMGAQVFQNRRGMEGAWAVSAGKQCIISMPSSPIDIQELIENGLAEYLLSFTGAAVGARSGSISRGNPGSPRADNISQGLKEEPRNMPKARKKQSFWSAIFPVKSDSKREKMRKVILLVCITVFIGSCSYIFSYFNESKATMEMTEELADIFDNGDNIKPPSDYPKDYIKKFAGLYKINPDVMGWLEIPGTILKHPVVQAADNDYYLRRDFNEKSNQHGVPFLDYRVGVKQPTTNTLIYGHNMKDGQMFGELLKYMTLAYYKEHPVITWDTVYREGQYKLVSVFITNAYEAQGPVFEYNNFIQAKDDKAMTDFINEIRARSLINTNIDVKTTDQLLTLSTCAYQFKDARFVVVARRVRDGENPTVDTSKVTLNPKPKMPGAWYAEISKNQAEAEKKQKEELEKQQALAKYKDWLLASEIQELTPEEQKNVAERRKQKIEQYLSKDEINDLTLKEMIKLADEREKNAENISKAKDLIMSNPKASELTTDELNSLAKVLIGMSEDQWKSEIEKFFANRGNAALVAAANKAVDKLELNPEQKKQLVDILLATGQNEWENTINNFIKNLGQNKLLTEALEAVKNNDKGKALDEPRQKELASILAGIQDRNAWNNEINKYVDNLNKAANDKLLADATKAILDTAKDAFDTTELNNLAAVLVTKPQDQWKALIEEAVKKKQGSSSSGSNPPPPVNTPEEASQAINSRTNSSALSDQQKKDLIDKLLPKNKSEWDSIIDAAIKAATPPPDPAKPTDPPPQPSQPSQPTETPKS